MTSQMASGMHNAFTSPLRKGVLKLMTAFSANSAVLSILSSRQHSPSSTVCNHRYRLPTGQLQHTIFYLTLKTARHPHRGALRRFPHFSCIHLSRLHYHYRTSLICGTIHSCAIPSDMSGLLALGARPLVSHARLRLPCSLSTIKLILRFKRPHRVHSRPSITLKHFARLITQLPISGL
ncbi:hypothetical protein PoB_003091200 [Plakobranchus ocellatus]|uniref:Uncharacterized protein n=1 Tax=Plakobranchus ocellatus TaxID=259542 RepID=A0AAV4AC00_9GAST|nr:hypothetical protein PoB_003091200 [Plakobranchus ocellatus]